MVSSSENSKSPFRGLECLRPFRRGERCVAVATDLLCRAVTLPVVIWIHSTFLAGFSSVPSSNSRQAEPRAIEAPLHHLFCQLRCSSVVTALT